MIYTDCGTKVTWDWCPLALANGLEWSRQRAGFPDRFDCLYRKGLGNKLLWYAGAWLGVFMCPAWIELDAKPEQA